MSKPKTRAPQKPKVNRALVAFMRDQEPDPVGDPNPVMTQWRHQQYHRNAEMARPAIAKYGKAALADFIAENPGQRPAWWWRYEAPEPMRRRVGGVGTAWHECETGKRYANQQDGYGIPLVWVTLENLAWWGTPPGPPVDPENPPLYEASAAYLRRHGLLSDAEVAALVDGDFDPEVCGAE